MYSKKENNIFDNDVAASPENPCAGGPHKGTVGYELRTLSNMAHRCVNTKRLRDICRMPSEVHFWILGYLKMHEEQDIFQKDLETEFEIRRSTVTGILQTMEKNGLIQRVSVDCDARLKKIILTDKAKQILLEHHKIIREFDANMIKGISQEEMTAFFGTLNKIKANLCEMQKNVEKNYEKNNKNKNIENDKA